MLPDLSFIEPQMPPPLCHLRQKMLITNVLHVLSSRNCCLNFIHILCNHTQKMLSQDPLQNTQMSVLKLNFLSILVMFRESPY